MYRVVTRVTTDISVPSTYLVDMKIEAHYGLLIICGWVYVAIGNSYHFRRQLNVLACLQIACRQGSTDKVYLNVPMISTMTIRRRQAGHDTEILDIPVGVIWCRRWYETTVFNIFSCDQAAIWLVQSVCLSVRLSVCLSVCLSHLFHHVPIIVSSWNFQELLPWSKVMSMQKVKVRGQRSRSQRSTSNLAVSGL